MDNPVYYPNEPSGRWYGSNRGNYDRQSNTSSTLIIAFEVVFSIFIFSVVVGCYTFGIRRRNKQRKLEAERRQNLLLCTDSMVEHALYSHEAQLALAAQPSMISSSSLLTAPPTLSPPPYHPPNPSMRLSDEAVSRLSQSLLQLHLRDLCPSASSLPISSTATVIATPPPALASPPKYSDIFHSEPRPTINHPIYSTQPHIV
ncbi:uncharacterized protein BYT42DRAFT_556916 [Radiomyces spectabilis]|uniref:uncharacterized protein n=1 Tax=Radiomyces spectabilis TaxID=64574 RepID=UPI002220DA98|nr:uncharacterized protein BYT42DRAFT_556916 [Radiomyces spectabilis]KAI8391461.1 hypothetical protein BYT42DRAFT_556916 [Radiomyces spectabilis]